jgi:predicted dehydrogenase
MRDLRAGVIGAGAFGRHHARKYAEDPRVTLIGAYDPHPERMELLAETHHTQGFDHPEDLIAAVDVVTVASPPQTHAEMARLALDAGKHVLIEKPLAVDPADGADLVARAERQGVVLGVGHQERIILEAIGLLAVPERPIEVHASRAGPWTGRSADVSVTMDLMIHDIDMTLALVGEAPAEISAHGRRTHGALCDQIIARARFPGGATARLHASRVAEERARSMTLVYPSGKVVIDFIAKTFENTTPFALDPDFMQRPDAQDSLGANVRRFLDVVLGERPRPPATGEDGLAALELAHAFDLRVVRRAA